MGRLPLSLTLRSIALAFASLTHTERRETRDSPLLLPTRPPPRLQETSTIEDTQETAARHHSKTHSFATRHPPALPSTCIAPPPASLHLRARAPPSTSSLLSTAPADRLLPPRIRLHPEKPPNYTPQHAPSSSRRTFAVSTRRNDPFLDLAVHCLVRRVLVLRCHRGIVVKRAVLLPSLVA